MASQGHSLDKALARHLYNVPMHLIAALPPSETHRSDPWVWWRMDEQGRLQAQGESTPDQWPAHTSLTLVCPPSWLVWHALSLPRATSDLKRQAAKQALEDQWLHRAPDMHVVLPGTGQADEAWVLSVHRTALREALDFLESQGQVPDRCVPLFSPRPQPRLHILTQAQDLRGVWCGPDGVLEFSMSSGGWNSWLRTRLAKGRTDISVMPGAQQGAESALAGLTVDSPYVQTMAEWVSQALSHEWDLLQGEFSPQSPWKRKLQRAYQVFGSASWRPLRWVVAGIVLTHALALPLLAWQWQSRLKTERSQHDSLLLSVAPETPAVVNAKLQLKNIYQRAAQSQHQVEGDDFLMALSAAREALPRQASAPASVQFEASALTLGHPSWQRQDIQSAVSRLQGAGWSAQAGQQSLRIQFRPAMSTP